MAAFVLIRTKLTLTFMSTIIGVSQCIASPSYSQTLDSQLFPVEGIVKNQVKFWEEVFLGVANTTSIVHDTDNPERIIDIIDHLLIAKRKGEKKVASRQKREELNDLYKERYVLALERFSKMGKKALSFGAIEQRLYSVYSKSSLDLKRLYKGEVQIRTQTGLADKFVEAAYRAQKILPYMEKEFAEIGVPTVITRLAFVESMFNYKVRSKVGASGIWQFMPATARLFMTVDKFIDERNNPYKATKGAAQLMRLNYSNLKHWPVAITAYNHGLAGMKRAIRETGSIHLDKIIQTYESKSFKFASKNFYAEFIAAARSYQKLIEQKIVPHNPSDINIDTLTLNRRLSTHQLLRYTPLDEKSLKKYNPCLDSKNYKKYRYRLLPKSFELTLPREIAKNVRVALAKINHKKFASSKR